jgi:hypothetical protein
VANESLWVFWFYWYRRPSFHEDLIEKKKNQLEGTNVIWFKWPSKTQKWLEAMDAESSKKK